MANENEARLLRLINACIALGASGETRIAVQLSETYLPETILRRARIVLDCMVPNLEIAPSASEPFATNPPKFDPERDLPGGRLPVTIDVIYPDGGGSPIEGQWVQSDGGGLMFAPEHIPDGGKDLDDFMQGVQTDSEEARARQQKLADALQAVYRRNHPDDMTCPKCDHQMIPDCGPTASSKPSDDFLCVNCGPKIATAGH